MHVAPNEASDGSGLTMGTWGHGSRVGVKPRRCQIFPRGSLFTVGLSHVAHVIGSPFIFAGEEPHTRVHCTVPCCTDVLVRVSDYRQVHVQTYMVPPVLPQPPVLSALSPPPVQHYYPPPTIHCPTCAFTTHFLSFPLRPLLILFTFRPRSLIFFLCALPDSPPAAASSEDSFVMRL